MSKKEYLMRSLMFVPANNERYLDSSVKRDADVLLLDIEDSVPPHEKQIARDNIIKFINRTDLNEKLIFPRINDRESGELLRDIHQLTINGIDGFMYPKATCGNDIYFIGKLLETVEYEKKIPLGTFKLIPLIETTGAVANIVDICTASDRVIAVAFGCEDFVTNLRGKHDSEGNSIFTARSIISIGARSAGVIPIDTVHIHVHDLEDLEKNLILSRNLGFEGMLVLSPKELPLVNKYYSPSHEDVDWATEMIKLANDAKEEGKGVAMKDNKFIGPPMVKMASSILDKHHAIERSIKMRRFQFRIAQLTDNDFQIYLSIKSEKDAVAFSGFKNAPDPVAFHDVFKKIIESENEFLYFLCDTFNDNKVCATFHFKIDDRREIAEGLGYNVFPEYRGIGIGYIMMSKINSLCRSLGCKKRLSFVSENNIASIKNLIKSGAYPTGQFEYRELPALKRKDKYLYYMTDL